jgi:glucose-6-phosphate 1-dehydrogenase
MGSTNLISTKNEPLPAKKADPCILVVFGITGDLTKRLLFPALCNLGSSNFLNENFHIIGVARKAYTDESFREQLSLNINEFITNLDSKRFGMALAQNVHYCAGDFSDQTVYLTLKNKLIELTSQGASQNVLFYFAAPPEATEAIAVGLKNTALLTEKDYFRRLVIEKPFGEDLESAKKLNKLLLSFVDEKQIFRIDHFLGKESVQNILTLRFLNTLFEPQWNNEYIDHVQISVAEMLGVESRGSFYDGVGALRDMVPNHLFQMLSLITIETPKSFTHEEIQTAKENALASIQKLTKEQVNLQVVRGQYGAGKIGNTDVIAYRAEENVSPNSAVETFVALKLMIDTPRWKNVPFYLRTGKRMAAHQSEIIIQFKSAKSLENFQQKIPANILHIFVQPNDGISLRLNVKTPGPTLQLTSVDMGFKYADVFSIKPQTGYETILYDCMNGNRLLFNSATMVETQWALVQPILDAWKANLPTDFPNYASGTWGPKAADELLTNDGRQWII